MTKETERLTKLNDAERRARFVETARKVETSDDPEYFEKAFRKVVDHPQGENNRGSKDRTS